jgi:4-oxalocrotonate tautomerase
MPFLHLKIFGAAPAPAPIAQVQSGLTDLMASVLRKKKALTVVQVEVARDSAVFCGGELPPAGWTGQLTAFVTLGTNTTEEKATFQTQAYALLCKALGEPSTPLYVIVQDVPAADWGYGGVTQAARAAMPALARKEAFADAALQQTAADA